MKKIILNVVNKLFILGSLVFVFFVMGNTNVKAGTQVLTSGTIERKHNDTVVVSFDYGYITKFDVEGNYYDGKEIYDNGLSLVDMNFYSDRSFTINYSFHKQSIFVTKENVVTFYTYNEETFAFESNRSFTNETGSYLINNEGIYKVEYKYDGNVEHTNYLYISKKVKTVTVTPADYYTRNDVFGTFKYSLIIEDIVDLPTTNLSYCAGFGDTEEEASKTWTCNLSTLSSLDKDSNTKRLLAFLSHTVKDSEVGVGKYFFVSVYEDNTLPVPRLGSVQTNRTFNVQAKVTVDVYLINQDGDPILRAQNYNGTTEGIHLIIRTNAPVKYGNLTYSLMNYLRGNDTAEKYTALPTIGAQSVTEIQVYHEFTAGTVAESDFKFDSSEYPFTHNDSNIRADVHTHFSFIYDDISPKITFDESPLVEINSTTKGKIKVTVDEDNFDTGTYYVAECNNYDRVRNVCEDTYDDSVASYPLNKTITTIGFNDLKEKFDGRKVWMYTKVVDKAGNATEKVTSEFTLDNIIVYEGEEEDLIQNVTTSGTGEHTLFIRVRDVYAVAMTDESIKPAIAIQNSDYIACTGTKVNGSQLDGDLYTEYGCLSVDYYVSFEVKVKLTDAWGNVEEYSGFFKNNNVPIGEHTSDGFTFDTLRNADYDAIFEIFMNNSIIEDNVVFSSTVMSDLKSILGIGDRTQTKRLIYLNGEEVIEIVKAVGNTLSFPTMSEIVEMLSGTGKYDSCSLQGNDCSIDLYLRYNYSLDLPTYFYPKQVRDVKISFKDNSNKYIIEDFDDNVEMEVNTKYEEVKYVLVNNVNVEIEQKDAVKNKKIMYTPLNGEAQEVESVDATKVGVYKVVESFVYNNIESFPLTYTVVVRDTIAPVVTLKGKEIIKITKGKEFVDPSVEASDNYDSKFTVVTSWDKELNVNETGRYTVSYWVVDSNGNKSNIVTRVVVVESGIGVYLLAGGIVLAVIAIITAGILVEKSRRRKTVKKESF